MSPEAVFLGSKAFGLRIFQALVRADPAMQWRVLHPCDQEDPRSALSTFERTCQDFGIDFRTVSARQANDQLINCDARIVFVCGWYRIIPEEVLDARPLVLGIHNSLLPEYRGGAPLVWAMIDGARTVGSSLFELGPAMDSGDVYLQVHTDIGPDDRIGDVLGRIEDAYERELPALWPDIASGRASGVRQDETRATYSGQRSDDDGRIDWKWSAARVHNFVRAQSQPYPGAFTEVAHDRVRVWHSAIDPRRWSGVPGQILERAEGRVLVACGEHSALWILRAENTAGEVSPGRLFPSMTIRLASE